jgi:hypothetical protein
MYVPGSGGIAAEQPCCCRSLAVGNGNNPLTPVLPPRDGATGPDPRLPTIQRPDFLRPVGRTTLTMKRSIPRKRLHLARPTARNQCPVAAVLEFRIHIPPARSSRHVSAATASFRPPISSICNPYLILRLFCSFGPGHPVNGNIPAVRVARWYRQACRRAKTRAAPSWLSSIPANETAVFETREPEPIPIRRTQ